MWLEPAIVRNYDLEDFMTDEDFNDLVADGGERHDDEPDRGNKPGVCGVCGYRIRPDSEEVTSNDGWDFDHTNCAEGENDAE